MIQYFLLLVFILSSIMLPGQKCRFRYNEEKRSYILHLPQNFDSSRIYPLVLSFHGLGMTARLQQKYTQMDCLADKEGFIVVYPSGEGRKWNTGIGPKYFGKKDDTGFISALLDSLIKWYPIDKERVYIAGMSLGGFFSYRLACELGDRIAAIASVTGVMSDSVYKNCSLRNKIPVLQIHGTEDWIVDYEGVNNSLGVEETVSFWVKNNQCVKADTVLLPDKCSHDRSWVVLHRFFNCEQNAEVWFFKVLNGGHTWPQSALDFVITGKINDDFNASLAIWEFFKRFKNTGLVNEYDP